MPTKAELKAELGQHILESRRAILPLELYFYIREDGDNGVTVESPQPLNKYASLYQVRYYGATRASGGVVVESGRVYTMSQWCQDAEHHPDPYRVELAYKVRAIHRQALDEKYARFGLGRPY